jgi:hypothetical protein
MKEEKASNSSFSVANLNLGLARGQDGREDPKLGPAKSFRLRWPGFLRDYKKVNRFK